MSQNDEQESKKTGKLPAELRKHYEESMKHNRELMEMLSEL